MNKQKLGLLVIALLLLQIPAHAVDALRMYSADGHLMQSVSLDNIQRLTFTDDNLLLKTTDGKENSYTFAFIGRISIEDVTVTGISVAKNTAEISLYPNPATECITIGSSTGILSWTLFDINGKTLKQATTTNVQTDDLTAGVYLLKIETAQGAVIKKIIKQ